MTDFGFDRSFAEVTIGSSTGISTFVPDGECYAIVIDEVFANGFENP